MGLLYMDWQLGRNTFMNKYNNFWKAVANGDYEGMRKESCTTWKDKKEQYSIYCPDFVIASPKNLRQRV